MPPEDHDLILAVAAGDRRAFATLARAHAPGLRRYVRALVGSDAAADDAVQETLLAAWRGAAGFRGDASVRTWLFALARRQAARTWRGRADPTDDDALASLAEAAGWGADEDPEAQVARLEDLARLGAALDALSPADREVVLLRDVEGLSGAEVAALLDLPEATMKTRLHRARLRLLAAVRAGGSP